MTDLASQRDIDLVLARLHLRLGSLQLARAELEEMAGKAILDDEGLIDLAEARWRTGDLAGAGEAANVALASGNEAIVALVMGPIGLVIGGLVVATADGGVGTGNGVAGGVVGMVVGLIGGALGGIALVCARRPA